MPSAAPSFLLLRFLCRHKENEGAGGTTPVLFLSLGFKVYKKSNRLTICCSQTTKYLKKLNLPSRKNNNPT
jgi:hypothetical protein